MNTAENPSASAKPSATLKKIIFLAGTYVEGIDFFILFKERPDGSLIFLYVMELAFQGKDN